jgi:DNA-binding protein Fis
MADELSKQEALEALLALVKGCAPLKGVAVAYVKYVLKCTAGNKVHAAARIGIDRRTIQRWLKPERKRKDE